MGNHIQLSNIKLILGARTLFENLTWEIQHDQKVGLIGPNGAGKSSLFKLIAGEYGPEPGGTVVRARGVTVGYLPQQPEFEPGLTAYAAALAGNPRLAELCHELEQVEASLGDPAVYNRPSALQRALQTQERLLEEYQALGGDDYPQRVRQVLTNLGLPEGDISTLEGSA